MNHIVEKIRKAKSLILSTHRECDGDGLGAEIGLYHALTKLGKNVRIINVDMTPSKYRFLEPSKYVESYEAPHAPIQRTDLCLIFDTNDSRLLGELYPKLEDACNEVIFIDHHPVLADGPSPTHGSLIDIKAASTGEIAFRIIKELKVNVDKKIARALYTSIAFDTQIFRYVRNSSNSHRIAAELLEHEEAPDEIHRYLFGCQTIEKFAFLAKTLSEIEYFRGGQIALLKIRDSDLNRYGLGPDDTRDVIDMIMNIESLEAAIFFREDGPSSFKVSLRSRGQIEVLSIAEALGGGGHLYAAGAFFEGEYQELKERTVTAVIQKLGLLRSGP